MSSVVSQSGASVRKVMGTTRIRNFCRRIVTSARTQVRVIWGANASLLKQLFTAMPRMTTVRLMVGVMMVACTFASWWGSGVVLEGLANGEPTSALATGLFAMLGCLVLMGVFPTLLSGMDKIGENWVFRHVQSEIAAKASSLDQQTLTDPNFTARLKQVKERAVWRMMSMMRAHPMIIRSFGMVSITLVVLIWYDLVLAVYVIAAFMPCVGIEVHHARRQSKVDEELAPLWGSLWGDLTNLTASIPIAMLQVFGANRWFAVRYRNGIERAAQRENTLERGAIVPRLGGAILGGAALVGVSLILMSRVSSGELALSKFVFLFGAVSTLGLSLAEAASLIGQQFSQAFYVNALDELLETCSALQFPAVGTPVAESEAEGISVSFELVSFRYRGDGQSKLALDAMSCFIAAGQKVAVVGPNGAGKSTAMSLMTRQVDPTNGQIRIAGVKMQELDVATLRKLVILMPQALRHYNLTVRELLNLGRPEHPASDHELLAALQRTGGDRFIAKWSAGLETLLGNDRFNGVEPSGGQLQRLLLTAVLLAKSRLIILDEPVSMVDPEAAKQFWDTVFQEMPHKTVLFSTHHLGAVRRANLILFVDEGKLVASGHHKELMEHCPRYRKLFESQAGDYR